MFNKLSKIFRYDTNNNEFIREVFDPISKQNIRLDSDRFNRRIEAGYLYDESNNILERASKLGETAFNRAISTYELTIASTSDPIIQNTKLESRIKHLIKRQLGVGRRRVMISMDIEFHKPHDNSETKFIYSDIINMHANAETVDELNVMDVIRNQNSIIAKRIDRFTKEGSGWIIHKIKRHYISFYEYNPLAARSYIPLPDWIQNKKATINIKNTDNKCFIYCLGRALDPNRKKHIGRE